MRIPSITPSDPALKEPAPDTEAPAGMPRATGFFLAANAVVFAALALAEGDASISARLIAVYGGLLPISWMGEEYWRFLAYGFLHFSPMHLIANSVCLLAWGVPIERRFGALRMAALYLGAIVIAGIGSVLMHSGVFVSAGASGGVSGLLGALFLHWLKGRLALPASFFVINIGLNIAIAFVPGIDWQAHLAGFLGGMALGLAVLRDEAREA
jgi:rhomboid protease GluP